MVESPEMGSRVSRVTGVGARICDDSEDVAHGEPAGIVPERESSCEPMAQAATTVALTEKVDVLVAAAAFTTIGDRRKLTVSKAHAARIAMVWRMEIGAHNCACVRLLDITAFPSFRKETPFWQGMVLWLRRQTIRATFAI
jgi:hypothetical protein